MATTRGTRAGTAGSGGNAEITLRLGYVTAAEHPYGIAINNFIDEVTTASDGAIAIEALPNYQGGDVPLLQDARGGAVNMASVSSAIWGTQGVNCFDALQALGLITRYDLEREVITGPIGEEMLACTDAVGLKGLGIHEGGLRKPLGATKPLTSPADFKGLTIRTPESGVLETGIRALGADPTAIPLPDTYAALRDGTVDGMEANLGLIQTVKYYEVAKFVTANVNLWPFPTVLVMNQAKFDALSADQQQIITDAAANIAGFSIDFFEAPSELVDDPLRRGPEVRDRERRGPHGVRAASRSGSSGALQGRADGRLHHADPGAEGRPRRPAGARPAARRLRGDAQVAPRGVVRPGPAWGRAAVGRG